MPNGLASADLAVTIDVPTSAAHAFAVDVQLPIRPGTLWAATSTRPDRSQRWLCLMQPVAAGDDNQDLACFSYDPARGLVPLAVGLHTLILHLQVIGPFPETVTGSVAVRGTRDGAAFGLDSFPIGPAM